MNYLFYSGLLYLLGGFLVGANGIRWISQSTLAHIQPVIHFAIGWVGLIIGFQLEWRFLRRFSRQWYSQLVLQYIILFLALFCGSFWMLSFLFGESLIPSRFILPMSLAIAILIPESSISFVGWSSDFLRNHPKTLRYCSFIAAADNIFPVILSGVLYAAYRLDPTGHIEVQDSLLALVHLLSSFILPALLAWLSRQIIGNTREIHVISIVLFASIFFMTGLGLKLGFSTLLASTVYGVFLGNTAKIHTQILPMITTTEKPIYIILLIYIALHPIPISTYLLLMPLILLLIKGLGRFALFAIFRKLSVFRFGHQGAFANLLLPISNLAPVIMLEWMIRYPGNTISILTGVLLVSLLLSDVLAPLTIHFFVRKRP